MLVDDVPNRVQKLVHMFRIYFNKTITCESAQLQRLVLIFRLFALILTKIETMTVRKTKDHAQYMSSNV